jgi:hypothetical protein
MKDLRRRAAETLLRGGYGLNSPLPVIVREKQTMTTEVSTAL